MSVLLRLCCSLVILAPSLVHAATLENPAPNSFQSGVGVISGWACEARRIEITFNDGPPQEAAYGTSRGDTQGTCGDTDNGFGLLFNWNLLGDGIHTVQALADGVEFASVIVIVTTLGEEFLQGASGTFPLFDFPDSGATRTLRWQEGQQNFVLTDGRPGRGGGTSGASPHVLENPAPGSFLSGIGLISGWVCDAQTITIRFDDGPPQEAAYGTSRGDTQGACGDTDNGFGLPFNWNLLDDGLHTVTASADGVEFARVEVTVTTLGTEFRRGLSREVTLPDFPEAGTDVALVWQEAQQNFVITTALPTQRLVEVNPVVTFPVGVQIPNVAVRSLYADTAEVLVRPEPSLLIAEDPQGTVLLGVANMDGGVLDERVGSVEVSVDSTAVVLVSLSAGYAVHAIDQSLVDAIQAHPSYPALVFALSTQLAANLNFLDTLQDYPEIVSRLNAVQTALTPRSVPQSLSVVQPSSRSPAPVPHGYAATVQTQMTANAPEADCDTRRNLLGQSLLLDEAGRFVPVGPTSRAIETVATEPTIPQSYTDCVDERAERWRQANERDPIQDFALAVTKSLDIYGLIDLAQYGWPYIAEVTAPCASRQLRGLGAQAVERAGNALAALGDTLQRSRGAGWISHVIDSNRQAAGEATTRRQEVLRTSGCPVESDGGTQTCHVYREPTSARSYPDYRRFDLHVFNPDLQSCEDAVAILNGPEEGTPYRLRDTRDIPANWICFERGEPVTPVYADELCQMDEDEVPGPPQNLRVTEVGEDFIVVEWDPPAGGGAASYNVYYRIEGGTETLLGSVDTPRGRATGIGDTRERCYRVSAVNAEGVEGEKTESVCVRTDGDQDGLHEVVCYAPNISECGEYAMRTAAGAAEVARICRARGNQVLASCPYRDGPSCIYTFDASSPFGEGSVRVWDDALSPSSFRRQCEERGGRWMSAG